MDESARVSCAGHDRVAAVSGVTHVTVNCALYMTGCEPILAAIDASPAFRALASGQWQGQPVRLYELVR